MANGSSVWKLKRYGRFVPGSKGDGDRWKIFEAGSGKAEILLTILESGHMMVSQGHVLLDGISLIGATEFLQVHRKSDNLLFRCAVKGESRLTRMQFGGAGAMGEAVEQCSSAVVKLTEYLPVAAQEDTASAASCEPAPPNQPPTGTATTTEQTAQGAAESGEPEAVQGSLSIRSLAQHFTGEQALSLPLLYRHSPLPAGALEGFLRSCLLDSSFPAFVEEVEEEMRKLLQE